MARFKSRYVLFRFHWGDGSQQSYLNAMDVTLRLQEHLSKFYGELALARIRGLVAKFWNPNTSTAIARIPRSFAKDFVFGCFFIRRFSGRDTVIQTLHISGTLEKCLKVLMRLNHATALDSEFFTNQKADSESDGDENEAEGQEESEEDRQMATTTATAIPESHSHSQPMQTHSNTLHSRTDEEKRLENPAKKSKTALFTGAR